MILGAPWGLLALLAVPAIIAIHCFRRRHRPVRVSAPWLYDDTRQPPGAGRRRDVPLNRPSLWCEILAALAVAWYLCDIHPAGPQQARHLLLVLDDCWRLQAVDAHGRSCADRLREELAALLRGQDGDDRVTLIVSGTPPAILAGPAVRSAVALAALPRWQPGRPSHPLTAALELALELGRGEAGAAGGSILVASDARPEPLPDGVGLLALGAPRASVGLADARWLLDGEERIALRIANGGPEPALRTVLLRDDAGQELHRQPLTLASGEQRLLIVPVAVPLSVTSMSVTLDGPDALAIDDRAELLRPDPRATTVHITWPEPAAAALRRALAAAGCGEVGADASPSLLADTGPVETATGAWTLALLPGDGAPVLGPFLSRRGDALLRDVDLTGCVWSGGAVLKDQPAEAVLLAAGEQVLLSVQETLSGARHLRLHAALERSTLTRHPAWPALIANLVAARRAALPGPEHINIPVGQAQRIVLPAEASGLAITAPDGGVARIFADAEGGVLVPGYQHPGRHRLALLQGDQETSWLEQSVLPADARAGDTRACRSERRAPPDPHASSVARQRGPLEHFLPLLLAVAAALAAWWSWRKEA